MDKAEAVCRAVNTRGIWEGRFIDLGHHPISQQGCLPDRSPTAMCLQTESAWDLSIANNSSSQLMTLKINKTLILSFFIIIVSWLSAHTVIPALSLLQSTCNKGGNSSPSSREHLIVLRDIPLPRTSPLLEQLLVFYLKKQRKMNSVQTWNAKINQLNTMNFEPHLLNSWGRNPFSKEWGSSGEDKNQKKCKKRNLLVVSCRLQFSCGTNSLPHFMWQQGYCIVVGNRNEGGMFIKMSASTVNPQDPGRTGHSRMHDCPWQPFIRGLLLMRELLAWESIALFLRTQDDSWFAWIGKERILIKSATWAGSLLPAETWHM